MAKYNSSKLRSFKHTPTEGKKTMDAYNTLDRGHNAKADLIHKKMKEYGINFASGVPCGVIRHVIHGIECDKDIMHITANRESEAIGIAAGAYFAGKRPVLYMQNSGLFAASNDIASLAIPYQIPIFMVITFRGAPGENAVQHFVTGAATITLLESFGIPHAVFNGTSLDHMIDDLFIQNDILPGLKPGVSFSDHENKKPGCFGRSSRP